MGSRSHDVLFGDKNTPKSEEQSSNKPSERGSLFQFEKQSTNSTIKPVAKPTWLPELTPPTGPIWKASESQLKEVNEIEGALENLQDSYRNFQKREGFASKIYDSLKENIGVGHDFAPNNAITMTYASIFDKDLSTVSIEKKFNSVQTDLSALKKAADSGDFDRYTALRNKLIGPTPEHRSNSDIMKLGASVKNYGDGQVAATEILGETAAVLAVGYGLSSKTIRPIAGTIEAAITGGVVKTATKALDGTASDPKRDFVTGETTGLALAFGGLTGSFASRTFASTLGTIGGRTQLLNGLTTTGGAFNTVIKLDRPGFGLRALSAAAGESVTGASFSVLKSVGDQTVDGAYAVSEGRTPAPIQLNKNEILLGAGLGFGIGLLRSFKGNSTTLGGELGSGDGIKLGGGPKHKWDGPDNGGANGPNGGSDGPSGSLKGKETAAADGKPVTSKIQEGLPPQTGTKNELGKVAQPGVAHGAGHAAALGAKLAEGTPGKLAKVGGPSGVTGAEEATKNLAAQELAKLSVPKQSAAGAVPPEIPGAKDVKIGASLPGKVAGPPNEAPYMKAPVTGSVSQNVEGKPLIQSIGEKPGTTTSPSADGKPVIQTIGEKPGVQPIAEKPVGSTGEKPGGGQGGGGKEQSFNKNQNAGKQPVGGQKPEQQKPVSQINESGSLTAAALAVNLFTPKAPATISLQKPETKQEVKAASSESSASKLDEMQTGDFDLARKNKISELATSAARKLSDDGLVTLQVVDDLLKSYPKEQQELASAILTASAPNCSSVGLERRLNSFSPYLPKLSEALESPVTLTADSSGNMVGYLFRKMNNIDMDLHNIDTGSSVKQAVLFDDLSATPLSKEAVQKLQAMDKVYVVDLNGFEKGINIVDFMKGTTAVKTKLDGLVAKAAEMRAKDQFLPASKIADLLLKSDVDKTAAILGNVEILRPTDAKLLTASGIAVSKVETDNARAVFNTLTPQKVAPEQIVKYLVENYTAGVDRELVARYLANGTDYQSFGIIAEGLKTSGAMVKNQLREKNVDPANTYYVSDFDRGGSSHMMSYLYKELNGVPSSNVISHSQLLRMKPSLRPGAVVLLDDSINSGTQMAQNLTAIEFRKLGEVVVAGIGAFDKGRLKISDPGYRANIALPNRFTSMFPTTVDNGGSSFFQSLKSHEQTRFAQLAGNGGFDNVQGSVLWPYMYPDNNLQLLQNFAKKALKMAGS